MNITMQGTLKAQDFLKQTTRQQISELVSFTPNKETDAFQYFNGQ